MRAIQERLLDLSFALLRPGRPWPARYGIAVLAIGLVGALKLSVPAFGAPGPDLFLTLPVAAAALLGGFGPAVVATIAATVLAGYFSPPVGFVWSTNTIDVLGFFAEGMIVSVLGASVRGAFARSIESLERRDELERERTALIATVNHELRNPLASLSGHLQLAARYAARDDLRGRVPAAIGEAQEQIKRLLRLADDLLLVSDSADAFRVEPATIDLGHAVEAAARRAAALDPTRTIEADVPPGPLGVAADPTRLDQIFDNLLKNAITYSGRAAPVEMTVTLEDERAVVRVRDRGPGVGEGERERIFARFSRGSAGASVQGIGVGLYVSRELARRMGGDVVLEETSSSGSVFTVSLPRADLSVEPIEAEAAATTP